MKFGIRECANLVFRTKKPTYIGGTLFETNQPVLMIDTAKTSTFEQATSTVYAQGGRGNGRLLAWEGDKVITFTVEDALLSPIGFSLLSGAGLFRGRGKEYVHYHMVTAAPMNEKGEINLLDAIADFGFEDGAPIARLCVADAPTYVMEIEGDGSLTGRTIKPGVENEIEADADKGILTLKDPAIDGTPIGGSINVMVDYYVDLPGSNVYEADITTDTFAGYFYVEADTLVRDQSTGKDKPANLTLPNVKIQSNFSIAMSGSGDPSSFAFTMDAFPDYTYFDKTKKVQCVLQIVDTPVSGSIGKQVMGHNTTPEFIKPDDGSKPDYKPTENE